MSTFTTHSVSIQAVTYDDIPALAKICHDAMEVDRHTEMKAQHEQQRKSLPGTSKKEAIGDAGISRYLNSSKCVVLKAVDDATGAIMGWAAWGFRGFNEEEMPFWGGASTREEDTLGDKMWKDLRDEDLSKPDDDERDESIKKLEAMTDADMKRWMQKFMPPGTRCLFVASLSVDPAFQRRGVGVMLLRWGTNIADEKGVFAWVHSSEGAWKAYAKARFDVVGTLDVDLDYWAVNPPQDGTVRWGHYVFRCMKYLPKKA